VSRLLGDEVEDHQAKIAVRKQATKPEAAAAMMAMTSAVADLVPLAFFMGKAPGVAMMGVRVGH
jgi:hypothetical protein